MSKGIHAVIVAYGRSAICRAKKGGLSRAHPIDWSAQVLEGVLRRAPQLSPEEISDLVVGCAMPVKGLNLNAARLIAQRAQIPDQVCAQTINRFCASGLQAMATCANAILAGQEEIMVAGGVEDMTHTFRTADPADRNPWLVEHVPGAYMGMGITAENVAARYGITRSEMEQMALESHQKAAVAQDAGGLNQAIIPVKVQTETGEWSTLTRDEGVRRNTSLEEMAAMKPCFLENGLVTAATSSQTSDGAAFAVLMSEESARRRGITPVARFLSYATGGCDPAYMGLGPIYAVPKALQRAGLTVDDLGVIELNEAFAAQTIACIRTLNLPEEKVNPWGGAIALGHPMGATGLFLSIKAIDYLRYTGGRYALVTMCIGGGMGAAAVLECLSHQE